MRQFGSLVFQKGFEKIKGLVIGRFQKDEKVMEEDLRELISRRSELAKRNIPIITGADFGHTTPIFTFGIGGTAEIIADQNGAQIFFEPFVKK
jgi:muramoyltetrapeptide carboxypeptidase LdcA involved in peptidoglycan recycling